MTDIPLEATQKPAQADESVGGNTEAWNTERPRWGFLEPQDDGSFVFIAVPKVPITLGGMKPPITFELYGGPRTIIEEPEG